MTDNKADNGNDLAMLFRMASRLMGRKHHNGGRRQHAHHAQHHVLGLLLKKGPMPQSELLEILDVRSSSLSELLRKLEHAGLVVRERSEQDRRSFVVAATDIARERMGGKEESEEGSEDMFACLDPDEQESLRVILEKLVTSLQEETGRRGHGHGGGKFGRGRRGQGRGQGRGKRRDSDGWAIGIDHPF